MSKQIRIEDDIHAWLLDHKDSQRRNVSDVIRELIEFREQYQSDWSCSERSEWTGFFHIFDEWDWSFQILKQ